ncbi:hypothetical protein [Paraglaciecola sp. MB-3u-78]|jgi:transposase-like protein|uniref:hypothetical protein n=1 Tax=Paraglaciecola sp. MB-3u-78 TaxID=2058332 RepID=UPI001E5EEFBE|nr:hypothetical protein [Paraglaciecola sp. MB-3u-78]
MKNTNIYAGYRYLHQIISHAVWFGHKITLSFRDIEKLLSEKKCGNNDLRQGLLPTLNTLS